MTVQEEETVIETLRRIVREQNAEVEQLRADLATARATLDGFRLNAPHPSVLDDLDAARADLATERAARERAEHAEIEAREATQDATDNGRKALVSLVAERDAALARANTLQAELDEERDISAQRLARAERAELSHKSDSDAFMRLFYAVNDDTTIRSISDSIARVADLRTKLAASESARAEAEAGAAAMREALECMLSPGLDWENGAIGVGNDFRIIARRALAAWRERGNKAAP